jgi:release factor glutamine methyltransferase
VLEAAYRQLQPLQESARADAEILLAFVRGKPRHEPYGFPEREIDGGALKHFDELLVRRCAGEPIAYLIGVREFWSLSLRVTPDTLVPRAETERLVELALDEIPDGGGVADLGTGSGAVALAIAVERPATSVVASDVSPAAVQIATGNAQRLGIKNVEFRIGNWCEPLGQQRFDVIVSNPPYLALGDPHLGRGDLRFEPVLALAGGDDGLGAINQIAMQCQRNLEAGGTLLIEHGAEQADDVTQLLRRHGYIGVCRHRDLAGLPRVCSGRRP